MDFWKWCEENIFGFMMEMMVILLMVWTNSIIRTFQGSSVSL